MDGTDRRADAAFIFPATTIVLGRMLAALILAEPRETIRLNNSRVSARRN